MARHQAAQRAARGPRRLAFLPLLLALPFSGCRSRAFALSGTITVATRIQSRAPKANSVLFVVAKNRGGVPVAVERIVNPQFPVAFEMTPDDLVVPGSRPTEPLVLEVEMNEHGNVGSPRKGDLEGVYPDLVSSGDGGIHVVIDRLR